MREARCYDDDSEKITLLLIINVTRRRQLPLQIIANTAAIDVAADTPTLIRRRVVPLR